MTIGKWTTKRAWQLLQLGNPKVYALKTVQIRLSWIRCFFLQQLQSRNTVGQQLQQKPPPRGNTKEISCEKALQAQETDQLVSGNHHRLAQPGFNLFHFDEYPWFWGRSSATTATTTQ